MSVAEMKRFIAENVERVDDPSKLEQIVHMIEQEPKPQISMKDFFENAVIRYGDVLQKLAE